MKDNSTSIAEQKVQPMHMYGLRLAVGVREAGMMPKRVACGGSWLAHL